MAERTRSVDVGPPEPATIDTTDPTTAQIDVPAEEFALAELFEQGPSTRVELEPAVANPDDHGLVAIEADPCDHGAVEAALRRDPAIAAVEAFGERSGRWTYRVTWEGRAHELLRCVLVEGLTVVAAWARRGRWCFRLLAPDRTVLSQVHEVLEERGYRPECKSISPLDSHPTDRSALTDRQWEAVVEAFETGYYHIPRDITAEELADRIGISHQALSERFRRAHKQLIGTTLRLDD